MVQDCRAVETWSGWRPMREYTEFALAGTARLLPVQVQDALRRKLAGQPAPGALAGR